ncbi:hypothetical protein [Mangrovibacterium lignilyticum]|uniref:hypothetical protein n=1 Tax=Mangrovibacterium lignilyticum TaxID=2668052 RepID=UPI0013D60D43|nr:hypothetical protein [Mangrovibacterium lignilyticum]
MTASQLFVRNSLENVAANRGTPTTEGGRAGISDAERILFPGSELINPSGMSGAHGFLSHTPGC